MSSSSSLGSLSTTSSKGSLSSLSFTDIYGVPPCAQDSFNMQDLHKRVEQILQGSTHSLDSNSESTTEKTKPFTGAVPGSVSAIHSTHSMPSLSPRSSVSSVSPPVSPYDFGPPPSYEQAYYNSVERQRRALADLHFSYSASGTSVPTSPEDPSPDGRLPPLLLNSAISNLAFRNHMLYVGRPVPPNIHLPDMMEANNQVVSGPGRPRSVYDSNSDVTSNPPLSPISESVPDELKTTNLSGTNTRSVSAAVSDESVAGDSGVFEACNRKDDDDSGIGELNLETAQVQIKLR